MVKMTKNKKIIDEMQRISGISLLYYEIEYLDALIEAAKQNKKLIIKRARESSRSFLRADTLFMIYNAHKPLKYKQRKKSSNKLVKNIIVDELHEIGGNKDEL